ncbi:MAG: hypothetical protein K5644_08370, partial [Lachnospiraceae bacterium]|nr:hypothetical protein [Lachnospiraceae bacterium]
MKESKKCVAMMLVAVLMFSSFVAMVPSSESMADELSSDEEMSAALADGFSSDEGNIISVDTERGIALVRDFSQNKAVELPLERVIAGQVYVMYDEGRGETFYTKNAMEAAGLEAAGWKHETSSDFNVVSADDANAIPVYRVYNPNNGGMHFYTHMPYEVIKLIFTGWNYEGISHYVYKKNCGVGTPQFRLYNSASKNGEHRWTADYE